MAGVRVRSGRRGKGGQSAGEARGRLLGQQSTRELPDLAFTETENMVALKMTF